MQKVKNYLSTSLLYTLGDVSISMGLRAAAGSRSKTTPYQFLGASVQESLNERVGEAALSRIRTVLPNNFVGSSIGYCAQMFLIGKAFHTAREFLNESIRPIVDEMAPSATEPEKRVYTALAAETILSTTLHVAAKLTKPVSPILSDYLHSRVSGKLDLCVVAATAYFSKVTTSL